VYLSESGFAGFKDSQDGRRATGHPGNRKIQRILILTAPLSESGFAGFKDSQDGRESHGSSWKSQNPENPDSNGAFV
jgi:hypothetical protein